MHWLKLMVTVTRYGITAATAANVHAANNLSISHSEGRIQ